MDFPQQLTDIFEAAEVGHEGYRERYLIQKDKLVERKTVYMFSIAFLSIIIAFWLRHHYQPSPTLISVYIGCLLGVSQVFLRKIWEEVQSYRVPGAVYLFDDKLLLISEQDNHTTLIEHSDIKEVLLSQNFVDSDRNSNGATCIIYIIERSGEKHTIQCNDMKPKPTDALHDYFAPFM